MTLSATRAILFALLAVAAAAPCVQSVSEPLQPTSPAALKAARAKWQLHGSKDYVMSFYRDCCDDHLATPVIVTVKGGAVVDVSLQGSAGKPSQAVIGEVKTVEGMFDLIEKGLAEGYVMVHAVYHPDHGAPEDVYLQNPPNADVGYRIKISKKGKGGHDGARERLEAARARWAAYAPREYDMKISPRCFCSEEYLGPFIVSVRDGVVVNVAYAPDAKVPPGTPVPPGVVLPTVEGMFREIERALVEGAAEVSVTYNHVTGVPESVFIDWSKQIADEETSYSVKLLPARSGPYERDDDDYDK